MAKRLAKWTINEAGNTLMLSKALENNENQVIDFEFPLVKYYPMFEQFNDAQKQGIIFMVKQKLMDSGANDIADYDGKLVSAKRKWQELLDGKWTGERTNATGAAASKKAFAAIKEAGKVVSLSGLMIKKELSKIPGQAQFTEEDEKKLDELLALAMQGIKPQAS
jgi:hypothetical protein